MRVPHNSCVLVADGRKMLFFRNEGDGEFPNLEVERKRVDDNPKDHEQGTDQPGRAFASAGSPRAGLGSPGANHRSAYSETDFHQLEEDRFAAEAAELLKERALRNDFESLVVVAPPKTLGELRKHYHKEVEKRLAAEVPKDLTNMPVEEIERILQAQ
ncbi:host attachment family protein [Sphingosinicella sp. CPCC 101087]|uniref:host attachment family protein n=1 Tax=Sphingosinicella sp. CPCC 101087 TaxID=2497754 RepID=UPI00101D2144|nr:host attachment family protein [Sphingosinicella sp. CPCC 101087]